MYTPRDRKEYVPLLKEIISSGRLPSVLYKHTKISEFLYDALRKSELWFSSPLSFNDPFDCQVDDDTQWTPEIIKEYIKSANENTGGNVNPDEIVFKEKQNPGSFAKLFTAGYRNVLANTGVACFVANPSNLLLWSHYSDSHKGVCLKYDITEDYELFALTKKMDYLHEYPKFDFVKERNKEYIGKAIFTKSNVWKYEDEIRTIQPMYGSYPINKRCLKEIIFGCKTEPNKIQEIRELIKDAEYTGILFKQVMLKSKSFDIEINEI